MINKITNGAGEVKSQAVVLREYFGSHPNQTTVEFMKEVGQLKPEDKEELVRGASEKLGYIVQ